MKKILFAMLFFGLACVQVQAQQTTVTRSVLTKGLHPGTVTLLDGQILTGFVMNFNSYSRNQSECLFYADYNDSRSEKKYKPKEIAGYSIENDRYKSVPYSGNISFGKPGMNFLYITRPGAINTLVYYIEGTEQLVLQKGDNEPVSNASLLLSFKKSVLKLVSDNTELAGKVERGEKGY